MADADPKQAVLAFLKQCASTVEVATTASRNRQSLTKDNFYSIKFRSAIVELATAEVHFNNVVASCQLDDSEITSLAGWVSTLKSADVTTSQRTEALQSLRLISQTVIVPQIEGMKSSPIPLTEQVLPASVVQNTRGYLEKIILQANGCYEHQWYDPCSVMVRRFIETLIIEVYEHQGKASAIKSTDGNFLMLSNLIGEMLKDTSLNLSRDTKRTLPMVKELGDRSAHNRHYLATRADIDKVIPGLRVIADELLHLAGLK